MTDNKTAGLLGRVGMFRGAGATGHSCPIYHIHTPAAEEPCSTPC